MPYKLATVAADALPAPMRQFIGLDLSLVNTGFALVAPGRPVAHQLAGIKTAPGAIDTRLRGIVAAILGKIEEAGSADLIALEGLSFASNLPSAQERAGLHFLLRQELMNRGAPFVVVPRTVLKKFVCETGAAKKDLMLKEIFRRYGVDTPDDNQADAAALAYFAASYSNAWPMSAAQRALMTKFRAPPDKKAKAA